MSEQVRAGGLPAVLHEAVDHLHLDTSTVIGCMLGENIADAPRDSH